MITQYWLVFALALFTFSCVAYAEDLNDPTRPPEIFLRQQKEKEINDKMGNTTGEIPKVETVFVLQSIFFSNTKKAAMINGQFVQLGHKVGDATLTQILPTKVVLKSGSTTQVLSLFNEMDERIKIDYTSNVDCNTRKKTKNKQVSISSCQTSSSELSD